jgi:hypothetical protein
MESKPAKRLVYIVGSGRSGSTLLDLLLNNSKWVQSLGEVHKLSLYARTEGSCTCGLPVSQCPFWLKVAAEVARKKKINASAEEVLKTYDPMMDKVRFFSDVLEKFSLSLGIRSFYRRGIYYVSGKHQQAAENSLRWYEAIREATGCPVIIDSTKDPRRLKILYLNAPELTRIIYMVRDGRAVAASHIRRLGVSMKKAAKTWLRANRRALWAMRGIEPEKIKRVHYEDLCRQPKTVMRDVYDFVGLPHEDTKPVLDKADAHNIGGNPMRFRKNEKNIQLDERWRNEISLKDLMVFEKVAGNWNRYLGYDSES